MLIRKLGALGPALWARALKREFFRFFFFFFWRGGARGARDSAVGGDEREVRGS